MNHGQNHVAAVLKLNNFTELFPSYNTLQTAVSLVNIKKPSSYRNNTTWGNQLAHTPLGLVWRLGCSTSPVWVGGWGVVMCLSGPEVCVILAVCQSGLGNGHRVITPALTASSISLYHSCTAPPKHTLSFFILFCKGAEERKNNWVAGHHKTQQWSLKSQWDNPAPLHSECTYKTDSLKYKTWGFDQVRSWCDCTKMDGLFSF